MSKEEMLKPREVAGMLGISYPTLKLGSTRRSSAPYKNPGGRARIPKVNSTGFCLAPATRVRSRESCAATSAASVDAISWLDES